jgi:uncharacterized protein (DUF1697 family)
VFGFISRRSGEITHLKKQNTIASRDLLQDSATKSALLAGFFLPFYSNQVYTISMQTYISMLRGINVGGQNKVRVADLKSLYESLGLGNVQTYVQSGNVVFDSEEQDVEKLRNSIETQIETALGFSIPVMIRTADDFQRVIESHPFANEDPIRVLVTFLYEHPERSRWDELSFYKDKVDQFALGEQEIFLFCPGGYGRTKLSNTFFEKKLGVVATTRNWKSVNTLYEMASERSV